MKLSELTGERAVEVIADLIEPVANIAKDRKNLQLFRNTRRAGETDQECGMRELTEKIPNLLRTHRDDVLAILCAVNGSKPEDLSVVDIIRGALELSNDQDFLSLFIYAVGTKEETPPTGSSADATNSEPES